ncbi:putative bifunctional diguanylate cyclase/phosphodiesterase [Halovulum sp. GXIMD14793]
MSQLRRLYGVLGEYSERVLDRIVRRAGGSADAEGDSDDFRAMVRARQIAAVVSLTPIMMIANMANVIGLLIMLSIYENLTWPVLAWAAFLAGFALYALLRTRHHMSDGPPEKASGRAIGAAVAQAWVLGLVWTFPALYLIPQTDYLTVGYVCALTAGMLAGGSMALYPIPLAAFVFSLTIAGIGLVALLLNAPYSSISFAMSAAVFILATTSAINRHAVMFMQEMRQRMKLEEQAGVIKVLLNDFKEHGANWLWESNADGEIINCSPRLAEVAGMKPEQINGMRALHLLQKFNVRPISDHDQVFAAWLDGADFGPELRLLEVRVALDHIQGETRFWELHGNPKTDQHGNFAGFLGWGRDVTTEVKANERIEYLATRDAMTGLLNATEFRHQFEERLNTFRDVTAYEVQVSVMYLDADKLKAINDSHGHDAGDALIVEMGRNLAALADDKTLVGRKGGDEFQVAIFHRPEMDLRLRSQDLLRRMTGSFRHGGRLIQYNTSIGISTAGIATAEVDRLLSEADRALYRAKESGGRSFEIYDAELGDKLARQRRLATDIAAAIDDGDLDLHYQPIVALDSDKTVACEALLRWSHPDYGDIEPEMIAELAETTGQIHDLGDYVLVRALAEAAHWPDHIGVSVNVSALQLVVADFPGRVQQLLNTHNFAPERLRLEIVETRMLNEDTVTRQSLNSLRDMGVGIIVDDFGVGYSGIGYLSDYPVTGLKIDASLTQDCDAPAKKAVVDAIIGVARALDISVVAEGVERPEQIAALRGLGCAFGQGSLTSRPQPSGDIRARLEKDSAAAKSRPA